MGKIRRDQGSEQTYRKRHVKCDETRPSCVNCVRWRGYCDGYSETSSPTSLPSAASTAPKLIHTKKAPLILAEPVVNTNRFANNEQRAYFDEWTNLSMTFLSGGLSQARLWTATMPQLTLDEPILRYGAMAVGALRKAHATTTTSRDALSLTGNKHYLNAITYYCQALRLQALAKPTKEGLRTALLSSLLYICFEAQQGNTPAALKHIKGGFGMLNELAACTDQAPGLVSIAPAPPAMVQEILDCYRPLELQTRSFMGSHRMSRPVGTSGAAPTPGQTPPPAAGAVSGGPARTSAPSPPSQAGTPWPQGSPRSDHGVGLPSPSSQGSPSSQLGSTTPQRLPPRPPGIAPFTKASPYFRPRSSAITSLSSLPTAFSSFEEALGYWSLIQRFMVQYLPVLTMLTIQLNIPRTANDGELEHKLASVKKHPKIHNFVTESEPLFNRWSSAFEPLLQMASRHQDTRMKLYLHAASLRVEFLLLSIYTKIPRFSGLATAQALTPRYREINELAEFLLSRLPRCGFSMDSGWTWPLFIVSFACRDPVVRDESIRILGQYPVRNALRDSHVFRALALKNRDVELLNATEGSEDEQWLRLRRREVVFEDSGETIIFRSSWRNPVTGLWELIEEISDYHVQEDGCLKWRRQPISDSASIMGGVC